MRGTMGRRVTPRRAYAGRSVQSLADLLFPIGEFVDEGA
jgi:hypothetical protein